MSKSTSSSQSSSTKGLVAIGIIWALFALMFFLLFSSPGPDGTKPAWFLLGITILETGAFAASGILCLRNWRSSQIVSGRSVWLWIGVGLLFYTLGNLFFFLWGVVWGLDPSVSLGDFFYILSYIFIAVGMFKAVLPRRLNLEPPQWLIIVGVGLSGILLAYFVNYLVVESGTAALPVRVAQATETAPAPEVDPEAAPDIVVPVESEVTAPAFAVAIDNFLEPFESVVGLLYLIGDCVLIIIAVTLLVAFWGGRYSQSWKLIAIAAFCLYIADMFFAYTLNRGSYVEGRLWEVFWTFSAVFFGLGAVVEYAVSTKSRRSPRRRRS